MQESTVRRTLIVVLCLCGVVAMWIFAEQAGKHQSADEPPGHSAGPIRPASRTADPTAAHSGSSPGASGDKQTRTVSDRHAPPVVPGVHIISTTYNAITIGWDQVQDAGGVSFYQVTLNGIAAGETGGNQLTINWFNDDTTSHFVQVWAYDTAGNRSSRGIPVAVSRPADSSPSWQKKTWPKKTWPKTPPKNSGKTGQGESRSTSSKKDGPDQNTAARDTSTTDPSKQNSTASEQNPASQPAPQRTTPPEQTGDRPTTPERPSPSTSDPDPRSTGPLPTDSPTTSAPTSPSPTAPPSSGTPPTSTPPTSTAPAPTDTASGSASPSPTASSSDTPTGPPANGHDSVGGATSSDASPTPSKLESPTGSPTPSVSPSR